MLQIIALKGLLDSRAVLSVVTHQLKLKEGEPHIIYQNGVSLWHWKESQRLVVTQGQSQTDILHFIEIVCGSKAFQDYQVWLPAALGENHLRTLRHMETEGKLQLHCFLLQQPMDGLKFFTEGRPEPTTEATMRQLLKVSQNGALKAEWIPAGSPGELLCLAESLLTRNYEQIYESRLLKETNRDSTVETPLSQMMRAYYSQLKQRAIHWTSKQYVHKAMDEERWGVSKLPPEAPRVERLVLVTGTGRSGTTWFSKALQLVGLDIGHQRNGREGCSGAEFAIDADWYPWFPVYGGGDCANVGERRDDYHYAHVFHVTRHPLWCIPSLQKNYPAINPEFWAAHGVMPTEAMDANSLVRNATMYYHINRVIEESRQAELRFPIEEVEAWWPKAMFTLGMTGTPWPELGRVNQATGWGQYEPLTWEQLEAGVGRELAVQIHEQARRYGYH